MIQNNQPQTQFSKLRQIFTKTNKYIVDKKKTSLINSSNYIRFFLAPGKSFNMLSRIILIFTNIIIFEKFLESKIIKIKLKTVGKNKIKTKFLEIIYKEFWFLPFVVLFYNIIVITLIYILYFCIYILVNDNSKQYNTENTNKSDVNDPGYLFNTTIFTEMLILTVLSFITNLIILLVVYYILVILSKEKVTTINNKDNLVIDNNFIEKFYSYYKFTYYSSLLFILIFLQSIEYNKWNKN